ncbi:MAG: YceI family protein [Candidatus Palauibacterales bacterium]|nr:YceI family protein [Candidatus Palauibacterales bacterium]
MSRWIFEPGHTAAEFTSRHMMVSNVRGHIKDVHGEIEFDPDDPTAGSVEAVLDARKLWTGEAARDEHLKSEDFLHVEEYPEITFAGDRVEAVGCSEMRVTGELTIRGTTREVALDVRYLGSWATPYWEDGADRGPIQRAGFVAETVIDRHDFGVSWNDTLDGGGVVVGDEVWIRIDVEALEAGVLE